MYNTHWVLSDLNQPHLSLSLFCTSNLWTMAPVASPASLSHLIVSFVPCWPRYPQLEYLFCLVTLCLLVRSFIQKNWSRHLPNVPESALSQTVRVLPPPRIAESFTVWPQHTLPNLLLMLSCEGTVSAVIQLERNQSEARSFWNDRILSSGRQEMAPYYQTEKVQTGTCSVLVLYSQRQTVFHHCSST